MAANEVSTQDAFDNYGNKLEQLKSSIRVFRHAFESRNVDHVDAMAFLFGLEDAAASLEDQFIALQNQKSAPGVA